MTRWYEEGLLGALIQGFQRAARDSDLQQTRPLLKQLDALRYPIETYWKVPTLKTYFVVFRTARREPSGDSAQTQ